jgi:hypothetical protein
MRAPRGGIVVAVRAIVTSELRVSCQVAAVALLVSCAPAQLSSNGNTAAPDGAADTLSWPPKCVPGIRETDCDWAGMQPATPVASLDSSGGLGAALNPELDRPCARAGTVSLRNDGDRGLTVKSVALTGSPAFTVEQDGCTSGVLTRGQPCGVRICFTSSMTGSHSAVLTFGTNAGDVQFPLSEQVGPPTPGLDPTFAGTGVRVLGDSGGTRFPIQGAALLNDEQGVIVWGMPGGLRFLSADGTLSTPRGSLPTLAGFPIDTIWTARAGRPGQGVFVHVGTSGAWDAAALVHLADDGTPDVTFGDRGVLDAGAFITGQFGAIAVQPSGRVLAMGRDIRAFAPNGQEDLGYRTSVIYMGRHAIDDSGRLYLESGGVIRLHADGRIDAGFASLDAPIGAFAVDLDQHLLVARRDGLVRLDDAGAATVVAVARQPYLDVINEIDVDGSGRILVTASNGTSTRVYRTHPDGSFDAFVGFPDGDIREVVCPRTGGCTIAGTLGPGRTSFAEDYVLRLAP